MSDTFECAEIGTGLVRLIQETVVFLEHIDAEFKLSTRGIRCEGTIRVFLCTYDFEISHCL